MDALKAIISIVLCIILLATEIVAMGLFSLNRALSEDAIEEILKDSMAGTEIMDQLMDEALEDSEIDVDGEDGEAARALLRTDAVAGFFAGCMASAIDAHLDGETPERISEEEAMSAFSQGIDELNDSGEYNISEEQEAALTQTMQKETAGLVERFSQQTAGYEDEIAEAAQTAMGEEMGVLYDLQKFMDKQTSVMAAGACALLFLLLVALNWRSRFGFFWCGIMTALAAALYWGLSLIGAGKILSYLLHSSYLEEAALAMVTSGLRDAAICGSIVAVIFLVIFAVLKMADRRRYE